MASKSRIAVGSKANIATAVADGTIDAYDILLLDTGEIGWQNADNETVINTPRTQNDIVVEDLSIEAGSTLDEAVEALANGIVTNATSVEVIEF